MREIKAHSFLIQTKEWNRLTHPSFNMKLKLCNTKVVHDKVTKIDFFEFLEISAEEDEKED